MPKLSRRDTKKLAKLDRTPKQKFKDWFEAKKKAGHYQEKAAASSREERADPGKGRGRGSGKGTGRGYGSASRPSLSLGHGDRHGRGKSDGAPNASAIGTGLAEGASAALMNRLIEMKQKLLAGSSEGKAQHQAWQDARGRKPSTPSGGQQSAAGAASASALPAKWRPATPVVREELVPLNQELAKLARTRDLVRAQAILTDLEDRGWANGFTYSAAVHTLCRCGDWQGAEAALARAKKKGVFRRGVGITSGVITRTAMLKGYFDGARDLGRAKQLFTQMEEEHQEEARPNTRTANTFLRGCLLLGAVSEAQNLLERMEAGKRKLLATPDASSYETVVVLLCQALQVEAARDIAKRAIDQLGKSPGSAGMFVSIARAAAVKGDFEAASSAVAKARKLLDAEQQNWWQPNDWGSGGGSEAAGSGGKRSASKDADAAKARTRSLEVFQDHRRSELHDELREVEDFMKKMKKRQAKGERREERRKEPSGEMKEERDKTAEAKGERREERRKEPSGEMKEERDKTAEAPGLRALWSRTLVFEECLGGESLSHGATSKSLHRRLCDSFGLVPESEDAEAVRSAFKAALKRSAQQAEEGSKKKRRRTTPEQSKGRLALATLFPVAAAEGAAAPEPRPVHLEICSGDGQWLRAQAKLDRERCWVACEVRYDRVAKCFQRFALQDLSSEAANVGLIAGDAHDALENRLLPSSCSRLFINHPEPVFATGAAGPELADSAGGEDAARSKQQSAAATGEALSAALITPDFLSKGCGAVLRPGGTLTICTDNEEYGRYLLDMIAQAGLDKTFEDAMGAKHTKKAKNARLATVGRFSLRAHPPPVEVCGAQYSGEAGQSYFQRLKQNERGSRGQQDKRFFLCLRRRKSQKTKEGTKKGAKEGKTEGAKRLKKEPKQEPKVGKKKLKKTPKKASKKEP